MATVLSTGTSFTYSAVVGSEISDDLLDSCAQLFSTNYGVWGEKASTISRFTKPGQSVKMNSNKLKTQGVAVPDKTVLATCFKNDQLVGHAFATVWPYEGGVVGWITQLVVDVNHRRRYIATQLLQTLKIHPLFQDVTVVGLASSHPAACYALAKYARVRIEEIDTNFIRDNAKKILDATTVRYLESAGLRGSLFQTDFEHGVISSVDTKFFVDHAEPLELLRYFESAGRWPLGTLLDGYEFLVMGGILVYHPEHNCKDVIQFVEKRYTTTS